MSPSASPTGGGPAGRRSRDESRNAARRRPGGGGAAERWMTVRADGASKGNPGPASCGIVIEMDGEIIYEAGRRLGRATNNVAEYEGLLFGLETAASLGADGVDVRLDAELLVRQIEGAYRVRNANLKPLHARAMKALAGFREWRISHVRREENAAADRAANEALKEEGGP